MSSQPFFALHAAIILCVVFVSKAIAQTAGVPSTPADDKKPPKLYELRIYQTNPGKLPDLHARFRDHTMKLFEKHGMENIIYWTLAEDFQTEKQDNTLVYILAHKNKDAADASWAAFRADPEWQAVSAKSEENGKLLASPPVSVYLNPTDFHPGDWEPNAKSDKPARLFELRRYNDGEARVPATVDRFKSGEAELFRKSGIETLGFWTTADNSAFVYLLGHPDRETANGNWRKFLTDFRAFQATRGRNPNPQQNPQVRDDSSAAPAAATQDSTAKQGADAAAQRPAQTAPTRGPRGGGIERRWLIPTDYSPRK